MVEANPDTRSHGHFRPVHVDQVVTERSSGTCLRHQLPW